MIQKRLSVFAAPLLLVAACSAPEATEPATTTAKPTKNDHGKTATAKPGAAIAFEASLRASVEAGDDGVLEVVINDVYADGTLMVTAASTTLSIAQGSQSYTTSLAGSNRRRWDIFFSVPSDGKHYVDLYATVTNSNGLVGTRSQSIPVTAGTGAAAQKSGGAVKMDAGGKPVMVMGADETIEE